MSNIFKKYVDVIENASYPLWYFAATFLSVVTLRNFLELFSDTSSASPPAMEFFEFIASGGNRVDFTPILTHFYFFYIALGLCLTLLLYALTKNEIVRLFKLVSTCFAIIVTPPIIDLL